MRPLSRRRALQLGGLGLAGIVGGGTGLAWAGTTRSQSVPGDTLDGTLANVALDRALTSDPYYPLAHLLSHAITQALPPAMLDQVTAPSP